VPAGERAGEKHEARSQSKEIREREKEKGEGKRGSALCRVPILGI
jgi:hypothetical protein